MRPTPILALPVMALLLSGQAVPDDHSEVADSDAPAMAREPEAQIRNFAENRPERCERAIEEVRDANGQPELRRGADMSGRGHLIAAVDKRIDGCAVVQIHGDPSDLRPVPETSDDFRLMPAAD